MNEASFQLAKNISDMVREPVVILDDVLRVVTANRQFCLTFGLDPTELAQRPIYELGDSRLTDPSLRSYLERFVAGARIEDFEVECTTDAGLLRLRAGVIQKDERGATLIMLTAENIVGSKQLEEMFSKVFNSSPAAMAITTVAEGRFVEVNRKYVELTGYSRDELIGRTTQEMSTWVDPEARPEFVRSLLEQGSLRSIKSQVRKKSGEIAEFLAWVELIELSGESCILTMIEDVTERKLAEEALREQAEIIETVNRAGQLLAAELELAKLVQVVTDAATALTRGQFGAFFYNQPDEDGDAYVPYTLSGAIPPNFLPATRKRDTELFHTTFSNEGVVRVSDVTQDPRYGKSSPHLGMPEGHLPVRSYLAVPVVSRTGVVLGALLFGHSEAGIFTERDERLVVGLAGQAAIAIDNARLFEAVQRERIRAEADEEYYRVLTESIPQITWTARPDGWIDYYNQRWHDFTGLTPEQGQGHIWEEMVHASDLPQVTGAWRQALETGDVYQVEYRARGTDGGYRWFLDRAIPLRDPDGQITKWFGTSTDIDDQKRAEETAKEQKALAETLRDTAAALSSTLDPELVMNHILENIGRVVPHEAANIMLLEGQAARVKYWRGYPAAMGRALQQYDFSLDLGPLRTMIASGAPHLIVDTTADSDWQVLPELMGLSTWVRSHASVPICSHGQVVGFLNLDSTTPGFFTPALTERLQAFADQAAVATENAQLYNALQQQAAELEQRVTQRTEELFRAKEQVEAILNTSSDAILVTRVDGAIQHVNPAFNQLFGYPTEEVLGQPLTALSTPEYQSNLRRALDYVLDQRLPRRLEIVACRKDGATFDADLALAPIKETEQQIAGIVCNLHDITERKQVEFGLRKALAKEREVSQFKSRFGSMVSHEFRNPLATILSASEMLKRYADRLSEERKREHLDEIQAKVKHLSELLDDILTISKAESVGLDFNPAPLQVDTFCRAVAQEIQASAQTRHRIVLSATEACGESWLDEKLLRSILVNLLSNAIKYSPEGSDVFLDVQCAESQLVIQVRDQGIGIPEQDQERLFEVFHRGSNVGSTEGSGLGLAITRRAVEKHGGSILFASSASGGTTFQVTLPCQRVSAG